MRNKIQLLLMVCFCIPFIPNAQTFQKGKNFINGGIIVGKSNIPTNSENYSKSHLHGGNIKYGRFIKNDNLIGLTGGYMYSKTNIDIVNGGNFTGEQKVWSVGGFYRRYLQLGNSFYFYGQSSVIYSNTIFKSKSLNSSNEDNVSTISGSIDPGISFRVYKGLHTELSLPNLVSLNYSKNKKGQESYGFRSSLSNEPLSNLSLGFSLIF